MNYPSTNEEWASFVDELRSKERLMGRDQELPPRETIAKRLAEKIEETILRQARQAREKGEIGVLFSGGVDSTLIAFVLDKHNIPFTTISVGFQDDELKLPEDIEESRKVIESFSWQDHHIELILNYDHVEAVFEGTIHALGKDLANAVNVGVGSVEYAGIQKLLHHNSKITQIFGGLGSEEIYAGYLRHKQADDKHEECWRGLKLMFERDLLRDFALAKHFGVEFWTPFLDKELISFSMNIPDSFKLDAEGHAKIILREAAVRIGLPKEFSFRPKRAAQYGSRTDKALSKLAHRKKYKYKKDYILSFFITDDKGADV